MRRALVALLLVLGLVAGAGAQPAFLKPINILENGTFKGSRINLNFITSGGACVDNATNNRVDCTLGGGGGGSVTGTGTPGQVAFWSGSTTNLAGDADFTFDGVHTTLQAWDKGGAVFNVLAYGADPTGAADSAAAINAAVAATPAAGGAIFFPAGTYRVDSAINLKEGCIYQGAGPGATTVQTLGTVGTGYSLFQTSLPRTCTGGAGSCDAAPLTAGRGAGCVCYTNGAFGDCASGVCAGGTAQRHILVEGMRLNVQRANSTGIDFALISSGTIRDMLIEETGAVAATTGVFFADGNAAVAGYSNTLEASHLRFLDICARIIPQGNDQRILNNSFSNVCGVAIQIDSNTNGNKVNSTHIVGNLIEGEVTTGIDDHGIGTMVTGNRFEDDTPMVTLEADGASANLGENFFSGTGRRIVDNGMIFWGDRTAFGSYATGQTVGTSTEGADNLLPDATLESWVDTSTVRGWNSVVTSNWDTTGNIAQETTIKRSDGLFSAKVGTASAVRGIATATSFFINPAVPYTLSFFWTTPNVANGLRYCFRLFDSAGAVITTGTVVARGPVPAGIDLENFVTSDLPYVAGSNGHCSGTDITPAVANVLERRVSIFQFPAGTVSARFMVRTAGAADANSFLYVDDAYFAEGAVSTRGTGHRLTDAADQTIYGGVTATFVGLAPASTAPVTCDAAHDGAHYEDSVSGRTCFCSNNNAAATFKWCRVTDPQVCTGGTSTVCAGLDSPDPIDAVQPNSRIVLGTADTAAGSNYWMIGGHSRNELLGINKFLATTITGSTGTVVATSPTNLFTGTESGSNTPFTIVTAGTDTVIIEASTTTSFPTSVFSSLTSFFTTAQFRGTGPFAQTVLVEAKYDNATDPCSSAGTCTTYHTIATTSANVNTFYQQAVTFSPAIASPFGIYAVRWTFSNWSATGAGNLVTVGLHHRSETPFPRYLARDGDSRSPMLGRLLWADGISSTVIHAQGPSDQDLKIDAGATRFIGFAGSKVQIDQAVGHLSLRSGTTAAQLRLYEASGSGAQFTSFVAQPMGANIDYLLPAARASAAGQVLSNDGAGAGAQTLSWATAGTVTASGPPASPQIAFWTSPTNLTGDADLTFDGVHTTLQAWDKGGAVYNVLAYGADPTGAADSAVAIQLALDAADAAGGGAVYVPCGTYKLDATLLVGDVTTLAGAGLCTTFKRSTTTSSDPSFFGSPPYSGCATFAGNSSCIGAGNPVACCSGAGTGSCFCTHGSTTYPATSCDTETVAIRNKKKDCQNVGITLRDFTVDGSAITTMLCTSTSCTGGPATVAVSVILAAVRDLVVDHVLIRDAPQDALFIKNGGERTTVSHLTVDGFCMHWGNGGGINSEMHTTSLLPGTTNLSDNIIIARGPEFCTADLTTPCDVAGTCTACPSGGSCTAVLPGGCIGAGNPTSCCTGAGTGDGTGFCSGACSLCAGGTRAGKPCGGTCNSANATTCNAQQVTAILVPLVDAGSQPPQTIISRNRIELTDNHNGILLTGGNGVVIAHNRLVAYDSGTALTKIFQGIGLNGLSGKSLLDVLVDGNEIIGGAVASDKRGILVDDSTSGSRRVMLRGNTVRDKSVTTFAAITYRGVSEGLIEGNTIKTIAAGQGLDIGSGTTTTADVRIQGNQIVDVTAGSADCLRLSSTTRATIAGNTFSNCPRAIDFVTATVADTTILPNTYVAPITTLLNQGTTDATLHWNDTNKTNGSTLGTLNGLTVAEGSMRWCTDCKAGNPLTCAITGPGTTGAIARRLNNGSPVWICGDPAVPAGSNRQVQFATTSSGSVIFDADAGLTYDSTQKHLMVSNLTTVPNLAHIHISEDAAVGGSAQHLFSDHYSTAVGGIQWLGRRAEGSQSVATGVANNDEILTIGAAGHNGTTFTASQARLAFLGQAATVWTGSDTGTALDIDTTAVGTTTRTRRARMADDGSLLLGTTTKQSGAILVSNNGNVELRNVANASCTASLVPYPCCTGSGTGTCGTAAELRLFEPIASGANFTAFRAQSQADITYLLPATRASAAGQVLSNDGAGAGAQTLSWATAGTGTVIGTGAIGPPGQVAYWKTATNQIAGDTGLVYDDTVKTLQIDPTDALPGSSALLIGTSGTLGDITVSRTTAATVGTYIENLGAGDAFTKLVAQSVGGNAYSTFTISGGATWTFGVHNADSDAFKLSRSSALGSSDVLRLPGVGTQGDILKANASGVLVPFNTHAGGELPLHWNTGNTDLEYSVLKVVGGGSGLNAGTSGGIPYFNSTSTMLSSALLVANEVVLGGGAGVAPFTPTGTAPNILFWDNVNALGIGTASPSSQLHVRRTTTGGTVIAAVEHTGAAFGDQPIVKITTGATTAGDPMVQYVVTGGVAGWNEGMTAATGAWRLSHPTTSASKIVVQPTAALQVTMGAASGTAELQVTQSKAVGETVIMSENTNSTSTADAVLEAMVQGTAAGDPFLRLDIPSGTGWTVGVDNSASDAFKVNASTTFATNPRLQLETTSPASGTFLQSDATKFAVSTVVLPLTAAANTILIASSANTFTALAAGGTNTVLHGTSPPAYSGVAGGDFVAAGTTSAQFRAALTDPTGTAGNVVFSGSPTIATPTITTSATVPLVIGGTTASSTLTLQSTSGVGTTDAILFKVGNNGGTESFRVLTGGNLEITSGTASRFVTLNSAKDFAYTAASSVLFNTLTDKTGTITNGAVFDTSPTFTTDIRTPLIYGGTAAGSALDLRPSNASGFTGSVTISNVANAYGDNIPVAVDLWPSGFTYQTTAATVAYTAGIQFAGTITQNAGTTAIPRTRLFLAAYTHATDTTNTTVLGDEQIFAALPTMRNGRSANANITQSSVSGLHFAPAFSSLGTGTFTVSNVQAVNVPNPPATGFATLTVSEWAGLRMADPTNITGTVTNLVGIDLVALTKGGTNNISLFSGSTGATMRHAGSAIFGTQAAFPGTAPSARLQVSEPTAGAEVFRLDSAVTPTTGTTDKPDYRVFQKDITTTGATVTNALNFTLTAGRTYLVESRVVARRTGGASGTAEDGAGYIRRQVFKTVAGVATNISATLAVDGLSLEAVAAWDTSLCPSAAAGCQVNGVNSGGCTAATDICVKVGGAATTNISWHVTMIVQDLGS